MTQWSFFFLLFSLICPTHHCCNSWTALFIMILLSINSDQFFAVFQFYLHTSHMWGQLNCQSGTTRHKLSAQLQSATGHRTVVDNFLLQVVKVDVRRNVLFVHVCIVHQSIFKHIELEHYTVLIRHLLCLPNLFLRVELFKSFGKY